MEHTGNTKGKHFPKQLAWETRGSKCHEFLKLVGLKAWNGKGQWAQLD